MTKREKKTHNIISLAIIRNLKKKIRKIVLKNITSRLAFTTAFQQLTD
jgi:hypothetical protein